MDTEELDHELNSHSDICQSNDADDVDLDLYENLLIEDADYESFREEAKDDISLVKTDDSVILQSCHETKTSVGEDESHKDGDEQSQNPYKDGDEQSQNTYKDGDEQSQNTYGDDDEDDEQSLNTFDDDDEDSDDDKRSWRKSNKDSKKALFDRVGERRRFDFEKSNKGRNSGDYGRRRSRWEEPRKGGRGHDDGKRKSRDRQSSEKNKSGTSTDRQSPERNQRRMSRDRQSTERNQPRSSRDRQIPEKNQPRSSRDRQSTEKKQCMPVKDRLGIKRNQSIPNKDRLSTEKNKSTSGDRQNIDRNQSRTSRDRQSSERNQRRRSRDRRSAEKNQCKTSRDRQSNERNQRRTSKERQRNGREPSSDSQSSERNSSRTSRSRNCGDSKRNRDKDVEKSNRSEIRKEDTRNAADHENKTSSKSSKEITFRLSGFNKPFQQDRQTTDVKGNVSADNSNKRSSTDENQLCDSRPPGWTSGILQTLPEASVFPLIQKNATSEHIQASSKNQPQEVPDLNPSMIIQNVTTIMSQENALQVMGMFGPVSKFSWREGAASGLNNFCIVGFYDGSDAKKAERILNHLKIFGFNSVVKIIGFQSKDQHVGLKDSDYALVKSIRNLVNKFESEAKVVNSSKKASVGKNEKNEVTVSNLTALATKEDVQDMLVALGAIQMRSVDAGTLHFSSKNVTPFKVLSGFRFPDSKLSIEIKGPGEDCELLGHEKSYGQAWIYPLMTVLLEKVGKNLKNKINDGMNIYTYKVTSCREGDKCRNKRICQSNHGVLDRRRSPAIFDKAYSTEPCQAGFTGLCAKGNYCSLAHSPFEIAFHHQNFRKYLCSSLQVDGVCKSNGGFCPLAHPGMPDMWYNDKWEDLYVEGLQKTVDYFVSAIENLYSCTYQPGIRVLLITPSPELARIYATCVEDFSKLCKKTVSLLSTATSDTSVAIATVDELLMFLKNKSQVNGRRIYFNQLKALIFDDGPSIFEFLSKSENFTRDIWPADVNIVITAEEINGEAISDAMVFLKSKTFYKLVYDAGQMKEDNLPNSYKDDLKSTKKSDSSKSVKGSNSSKWTPVKEADSSSMKHTSHSSKSSGSSPSCKMNKRSEDDYDRYSETKEKLKRMEDEYVKAKKVLKEDIIEKSKLYTESPKTHPLHDKNLSAYLKDYLRLTPGKIDMSKAHFMWKKVWKEFLASNLEEYYGSQISALDKKYKHDREEISKNLKDLKSILDRKNSIKVNSVNLTYEEAKKELQYEHDRKIHIYGESPELHPDYEKQYSDFMVEYKRRYPNDIQVAGQVWKSYWDDWMTTNMREDYRRKKLALEDKYRNIDIENSSQRKKRKSSPEEKRSFQEKRKPLPEIKQGGQEKREDGTYDEAMKALLKEKEERLLLYIESPHTHPDYTEQYSVFITEYKKRYPDEIRYSDFVWKNFWRDLMTSRLKQEYARKKEALREMYKYDRNHDSQTSAKRKLPTYNELGSQMKHQKKERRDHHNRDDLPSESARFEPVEYKTSKKDNVFNEETLELLSEVSPYLGILGPAIEMLKSKLLDCMRNKVEGREALTDPGDTAFLEQVYERLSELKENSKSPRNGLKFKKAGVLIRRLLDSLASPSKDEKSHVMQSNTVHKVEDLDVSFISSTLKFALAHDVSETNINKVPVQVKSVDQLVGMEIESRSRDRRLRVSDDDKQILWRENPPFHQGINIDSQKSHWKDQRDPSFERTNLEDSLLRFCKKVQESVKCDQEESSESVSRYSAVAGFEESSFGNHKAGDSPMWSQSKLGRGVSSENSDVKLGDSYSPLEDTKLREFFFQNNLKQTRESSSQNDQDSVDSRLQNFMLDFGVNLQDREKEQRQSSFESLEKRWKDENITHQNRFGSFYQDSYRSSESTQQSDEQLKDVPSDHRELRVTSNSDLQARPSTSKGLSEYLRQFQ